jgi:TldD protein
MNVMSPGTALALARTELLDPAGITDRDLQHALGLLMHGDVDNADLYFQVARQESWSLEDGIVKEGATASSRASACGRWPARRPASPIPTRSWCRHCNQAAEAARAIVRQRPAGPRAGLAARAGHRLYPPIDPLLSLADEDKVACCSRWTATCARWIRASNRWWRASPPHTT